jgi:hypothetical protein
MDETRELLLKEYAEAGLLLRQHELLTRTSASVFVPTLVALAGYILGSDAGLPAKVVLAFVGLIAALLAANVLRRHQLYYRNYIARAKEIERQLQVGDKQVINLYSGAEAIKRDSCTMSSKKAFITFFVLSALLFLGSGVVFAWQQFSACAP